MQLEYINVTKKKKGKYTKYYNFFVLTKRIKKIPKTVRCQREIPLDPACAICNQHDETVAHALWECPMARNVWAMVAGKLQKRNSVAEDFYSLVRELMAVLTSNEVEVWAIVSWAIWNARNRYLFYRKQTHPSDIL